MCASNGLVRCTLRQGLICMPLKSTTICLFRGPSTTYWSLSRMEMQHTKEKCCPVEASTNIVNVLSKPAWRRSKLCDSKQAHKRSMLKQRLARREPCAQTKEACRRQNVQIRKRHTWGKKVQIEGHQKGAFCLGIEGSYRRLCTLCMLARGMPFACKLWLKWKFVCN